MTTTIDKEKLLKILEAEININNDLLANPKVDYSSQRYFTGRNAAAEMIQRMVELGDFNI